MPLRWQFIGDPWPCVGHKSLPMIPKSPKLKDSFLIPPVIWDDVSLLLFEFLFCFSNSENSFTSLSCLWNFSALFLLPTSSILVFSRLLFLNLLTCDVILFPSGISSSLVK